MLMKTFPDRFESRSGWSMLAEVDRCGGVRAREANASG